MATYDGMLAETVRINGHEGDQIDAYLARPLGAGPYPGVVLIHHMPGWDEASKEMARKFAYNGYVCISPHIHHREGPGSPDDISAAVRAAGGNPDARCIGDVQASVDYLKTLPYYSGKVGTIGFCSGGRQVYLVACNIPELDAAVDLERYLLGATTDHTKELRYPERKAIHNLKYFTWVEQQGKTVNELDALWSPSFWTDQIDLIPEWDDNITAFNVETGVRPREST